MVENGCENSREVHDLGALGKSDHKQLTPVCLHQMYLKFNATINAHMHTHRHI